MITRSFRKIVSGLFYRERTKLKPSYVNKMLVARLNELLGKKKTQEDPLWEVINADMKTRFVWRRRVGDEGGQGSQGGDWERFTRETLIHDNVTIAITMKMLSDFFGFTLNTDAWDTLQKPETYDYANPFHPSFIRSIWPRVKQMNIAHHALGLKLLSYVRASERRQESVPRYILQGTTTHFQQALAREPSSAVSMRKLGQTLEEIWLNEQKSNPNSTSCGCAHNVSNGSNGSNNLMYLLRLQHKIEWAFEKAIARDKEDSFSKFCLGVFYDMLGRRNDALVLYRTPSPRTYSLGNVITADALLYFNGGGYAKGCDERALDEAEALYRKAAADLSAHGVEKSLNNLAVLLCYRGKVAEAGQCFARALSACKKSLWRIGPNCATYCDLVLKDLVLKQSILEEKEKQEAMLENVQE